MYSDPKAVWEEGACKRVRMNGRGGGGITLALGDKVRSLLTFASIYTQSPLY